MTVLLRRAVTARGAPWVQPVQHLLRLVGPFPRTAVLQVGQVGGEDLVDLGALRGARRRHRAPDAVGGGGYETHAGQTVEHYRHGTEPTADAGLLQPRDTV